LTNVVLNAIEAAKRPGDRNPQVIVELQRVAPDGAAIHVKDTGPGPDASLKENLFEPFVSEKPEGAGLGLFVAQRVAQAHHGSIRWQRIGQLTSFTIQIPLLAAVTDHGSPADR
jgi:nitrogen-specific signal transduction histidine kinase